MTSKLDQYPNLKKAAEAKRKKAEARAAAKAEEEAKKKKIIEDSSDEDSEPEIDVAAYLSDLCQQQLQLAYKQVIKPKIKKLHYKLSMPPPPSPVEQHISEETPPVETVTVPTKQKKQLEWP